MSRNQNTRLLIISGVLCLVLIVPHFFFADPVEFHGIHVHSILRVLRWIALVAFIVALSRLGGTPENPDY